MDKVKSEMVQIRVTPELKKRFYRDYYRYKAINTSKEFGFEQYISLCLDMFEQRYSGSVNVIA